MTRTGLAVLAGLAVVTPLSAPAALAGPLRASAGAGAPPSATVPALALPHPTGPAPVGRVVLDLVDRHRADPWVPTERRELMVSVWYPAQRASSGRPAPYMTAAESRLTLQGTAFPPEALTTVVTHAQDDAAPRPGRHRFPLVVLSPGLGASRATLTGLAEELASRGYVVAGIDHTYEAAGISFPDGRVATCLVCEDPAPIAAKITTGRARDVSFVLNRLLARHSAWSGGEAIDPARIAMAGHSIGGASALTTMLTDHRVDAGADLDGTFHPAPTRPLHRPFLMVGNEDHGRGSDPSPIDTWPQLRGRRQWLGVTGTTHNSFTDLAVLSDQAGAPIQTISGARASQITRAYVTAFFDEYLRHRPQPLLAGPTREYSEVRFFSP